MGGKQLGLSDYELTTAQKQAKREKFLAEMEEVQGRFNVSLWTGFRLPSRQRQQCRDVVNHRLQTLSDRGETG